MTTESRILDIIVSAVQRYKSEGMRGIEWVFDRSMTQEDKLAFDLFLVRTKDSLAFQPGTTEYRFKARVIAMAKNVPLTDALTEAR
jgi:hypothetical protein